MIKEKMGRLPASGFVIVVIAWLGSLLLPGCMEATNQPVDTFLVRVGKSTLTVSEFNEVFEISKTAYSHSDTMDPQVVADIKLRLLNQLVEEMIIIEQAAAAGIAISDAELESEVSKIREDYPEGVFEEMLLEAAVSFEAWKKRLRMQLTARKFIATELEAKIKITTEEVAEYYATHFPDGSGLDTDETDARSVETQDGEAPAPPDAETEGRPQAVTDAMILKMLKSQKVQAAYADWMKVNRDKVTIDINARQWERIARKNS